MSNMSHCRFTNTLADLRDCEEALGNLSSLDDIDHPHERRAAKNLIKLAQRIGNNFEDYLDTKDRSDD